MADYFDRVLFQPAAGGLADFIPATAVAGYRKPAEASVPNAAQPTYFAESVDRSQWEIGVGNFVSGGEGTVQRTTIRASSNGNAKVNFTVPPRVGFHLQAADILPLGTTANDQILFRNSVGDIESKSYFQLNSSTGKLTYNPGDFIAGGGLRMHTSNPDASGDPNHNYALGLLSWIVHDGDNNIKTNPTFANQHVIQIDFRARAGQYNYSLNRVGNDGNSAKISYMPLDISTNIWGAAQKFAMTIRANSYGMGDSACFSWDHRFSGGPMSGDEATGFSTFNYCMQHHQRSRPQVNFITRPNVSATLSQLVIASKDPQWVTLSNVTNISVGTWLMIDHNPAEASPAIDHEAVRVVEVNVGLSQVRAVFRCRHISGRSVKACCVINTFGHDWVGEHRLAVNLSGPTYEVGTISGFSGAFAQGVGTNWTPSMVGGDATVPGVISLNIDNITHNIESSGYTDADPGRAWYQICSSSLMTTTTLIPFVATIANIFDAYKGRANDPQGHTQAGPYTYVIRPGCRIIAIPNNGQLVLEPNTFAWNQFDVIECAICPYPDCTMWGEKVGTYLPGAKLRAYRFTLNHGLNAFEYGYFIGSQFPGGSPPPGGALAHPYAWVIGYAASSCFVGIDLQFCSQAGISLRSVVGDNAWQIQWGSTVNAPMFGNSPTLGFVMGARDDPAIRWLGPSAAGNPSANLGLYSLRGGWSMELLPTGNGTFRGGYYVYNAGGPGGAYTRGFVRWTPENNPLAGVFEVGVEADNDVTSHWRAFALNGGKATSFSGDQFPRLLRTWSVNDINFPAWGWRTQITKVGNISSHSTIHAFILDEAFKAGVRMDGALMAFSNFSDVNNFARTMLRPDGVIQVETAGSFAANVDLWLLPSGTGNVRFGAHAALAGETVTGYIMVKDVAGTQRKLAVVS